MSKRFRAKPIQLSLWGVLLLVTSVCAQPGESTAGGTASATGDGGDGGDGEALALVDGEPITRQEVNEAAREQWEAVELERLQCEAQAKQKHHQVLQATVESLVREQMTNVEAQAAGSATEDWLTVERERYRNAVSDAEVDTWYQQNQARIRRPKEQVAGQIRDLLANEKFIQELKARHEVVYQIDPYRVEVEVDGSPSTGPAAAPVTIVEFSDFQCPYCKRVNPAIEKVKEKYGEQVRLVFRQYPLNHIHPQAQKAAEAALCADEQGRFWEMHDLMFEEQQKLTVADLKDKAVRLNLDQGQFNDCLDSGKASDQVQADLRAGAQAGVSGTPALFVNGRFLSGAVPFEQIAEVIDEELEEKGLAKD